MKCTNNCRCGKHHAATRSWNRTIEPSQPGFAAQQRQRVARATAERHAAGRIWRDHPSERFDFDAAIKRLHGIFTEVYGPQWRSAA